MTEHTSMRAFSRWLENYLNFEKNPKKDIFKLDTMKFLCAEFGNPQNTYKSIHIAGSKGKGSVSAFCASILEEAGFKTGLYTSPHVEDIRERITAPTHFFTEEEYSNALQAFIPAADLYISSRLNGRKKPTWFELMTLFAFFCFRNCKTQWAVFETGMGGRLDATNVLHPQACAITTIELEHTEYLGSTTEAIAYEKAGIIKPDIPVCIARQSADVKKVFKAKAAKEHTPIFFIEDIVTHIHYIREKSGIEILFAPDAFCALNGSVFFSRPIKAHLKLHGAFQTENAALAAAAVKTALPDIDEQTIERGLEKAFLPGRFEIIHTKVRNKALTIVIDGCHTPNSIRGTLETFFADFGPSAHLLFACAEDKDVDSMASIIKDSPCSFSKINLTIPGKAKHSDYDKTLKSFYTRFEKSLLNADKDYTALIHNAFEQAAAENKALLCAGSFYLAGEVKKAIQKNRLDSCPPQ
ncbi:bifunctional folylpolyglutamate synthase/dihydrofolate synthase [Treponema sp. OMZ 840]|uniref:bifunctional folylpolyglutamate synthase/dihydrofolate synthase n=1 Tax=Treponema sp. OMZ 840 TaxID=244313 RepID=UPI003D8D1D43